MRNIKPPSEVSQNGLFDAEAFGWWHTQLAPEAFRRLANGMEGVIRTSILKLMPANEIGESFSEAFGRPTKELYAICGLLLLAEFRNWTVDQTADAWCFDASVQFALNLPRDRQNLCSRTVDNYRRLMREDEQAQEIFERVTTTIVEDLELTVSKQRLDSTHVLSGMAKLGRTKLMAVTVKRFLTQLKRHEPQAYAALDAALRERYEVQESRLFGFGSKQPQSRDEALQQTAEDMYELLALFGENEAVSKRSSFCAMARVFEEQCELTCGDRFIIRAKGKDENGQTARVMQNPSDPDAGYSGHKGSGYQVQIAQVFESGENAPGLITACIPQSAAESDSAALEPVTEQQKRMGTMPEVELTDTAYGSQSNVEKAAQAGVKLVAPVPGAAPSKKAKRESETGTQEGKPQAKDETAMSAAKPTPGSVTAMESATATVVCDHKAGLESRREAELTKEWKKLYNKRSGIEGLHSSLDRTTGLKTLRVRGMKAVAMAIFLKVTGWNIRTAVKIAASRAKTVKNGPNGPKSTAKSSQMRDRTRIRSQSPLQVQPIRHFRRRCSHFRSE
jgi:hypothetical protein